MPGTKTFILNDESAVNIYGFRVPNKALSLDRFRANPVMLAEHFNALSGVVGRWANLRVEGGRLMADAEFDQEDPDAKRLEGKVDRGYVKGVSIGFIPREYAQAPDGVFELAAGELCEASICAIPANANAVKLYAKDGQMLSDEAVHLSLNEAKEQIKNPTFQQTNMKQLQLSILALVALGFTQQPTDNDSAALSASIEKLASDLKTEREAHVELKRKYDALTAGQGKTLIDSAIAGGKITEADRAEYAELAQSNYELAAKMLAKLPAATSLAGQVGNPAAPAAPKTADEFEKLTLEQQLGFKKSNPEGYKKLFA